MAGVRGGAVTLGFRIEVVLKEEELRHLNLHLNQGFWNIMLGSNWEGRQLEEM